MAGEKIKQNIRDRLDSVKAIPDNVVNGARIALDRVSELKPVQAVVETADVVGHGVLTVVDKNAEITRRWLGEVRP